MSDEESVEEVEEDEATALGAVDRFLEWAQSDECDIVSSVIIVAEIIDSDGAPCLAYWSDFLSGHWKHTGMLRRAARDIDMMSDEDDSYFELVAEEGEDGAEEG